jgi:hypothetical protein
MRDEVPFGVLLPGRVVVSSDGGRTVAKQPIPRHRSKAIKESVRVTEHLSTLDFQDGVMLWGAGYF